MLGIVFLGLLVFFLYNYRLKDLEGRVEFKKTLVWSEWGKCLSAGQPILIIVLTIAFTLPYYVIEGSMPIIEVFLFPFNALPYTDPLSQAFIIGTLFLPLFFTSLIHRKIVRPLSEGRILSKETFNGLFKIGLFFVILLGILGAGMAYMNGIHELYTVLPLCLGLFTSGVLAVGKAIRHYPKP